MIVKRTCCLVMISTSLFYISLFSGCWYIDNSQADVLPGDDAIFLENKVKICECHHHDHGDNHHSQRPEEAQVLSSLRQSCRRWGWDRCAVPSRPWTAISIIVIIIIIIITSLGMMTINLIIIICRDRNTEQSVALSIPTKSSSSRPWAGSSSLSLLT